MARGWQWFREHSPSPGWLGLSLLLTALLCPALSFTAAGWYRDAWMALPALLAGCVIGYALAALPLSTRVAWSLLLPAGVQWSVLIAARFFPHPLSLWYEAQRSVGWLSGMYSGRGPTELLPGIPLLADGLTRVGNLMEILQAWLRDAVAGHHTLEGTPFLLLCIYAGWYVGAAGGWGVRRGVHALGALSPAGVALVLNALYAETSPLWIPTFLGATFLLAMRQRWEHLRRQWQSKGTDYSEELALGFHGLGTLLTTLLLLGASVLTPLLESISPRQIANAFWQHLGSPIVELDREMRRVFPPLERAGGGVPVAIGGPGVLPRKHLLGGNPSLAQELVFQVQVTEPDGAHSARLWRQTIYDTYTGRGWVHSAPREQQHLGGTLTPPTSPDNRRQVRQHYRWASGGEKDLVFLSEPAWIEPPARCFLGPGDTLLAAAAAEREYRAISWVPNVDEDFLRQEPPVYPEWIETYLRLPSIPPEVITRTAQWTEGQSTPYDAARALEDHLRALPYTLEIPPPPPDREATAYLLFDAGQGYCDYFATAMAVMARVAGIPSRFVSGYAGGEYDESCDCYWVSKTHSHSWAELYFPHVGWVPFEATPSQPVPSRARTLPGEETSQPLPPPDRWWRPPASLPMGIALIILAAGLALTLACWRILAVHVARLPSRHQAQRTYAQLVRWGKRLGVGWRASMTAPEYLQAALTWAASTSLSEQTAQEAVEDAHAFGRAYSVLLYGGSRDTEVEREELRRLREAGRAIRRLLLKTWAQRLCRRLLPGGISHQI